MYKAYCDEEKAVFLCLMQKKKSQIRLNLRLLAEMVGFEPTCPCGQPLFESGALQPTSLHLRTRLTIICYEARQRQTKSD